MVGTLPDRCPSKHLGFPGIGLCHQRPVPQHLGRARQICDEGGFVRAVGAVGYKEQAGGVGQGSDGRLDGRVPVPFLGSGVAPDGAQAAGQGIR